jgi:hypothetical protein
MRKPINVEAIREEQKLIALRLGDMNAQDLRDEGRALGYLTISSYVRRLIIEGRKVLAPKPKARIRKARG